MESKEAQLHEIDVHIDDMKLLVKRKDMVAKLTAYPEFKELITEGYLEKEASRLALMIADPNMQSDEDQREIMSAIKAIGHFRQYLLTITMRGKQAEAAIEQFENEREVIEQED